MIGSTSEMAPTLTFAQVSSAIATSASVSSANFTKFQARLKNFQRLGLVDCAGTQGKAARYSAEDCLRFFVAIGLTDSGMRPEDIVTGLRQTWGEWLGAFSSAAIFEDETHLLAFGVRALGSDEAHDRFVPEFTVTNPLHAQDLGQMSRCHVFNISSLLKNIRCAVAPFAPELLEWEGLSKATFLANAKARWPAASVGGEGVVAHEHRSSQEGAQDHA